MNVFRSATNPDAGAGAPFRSVASETWALPSRIARRRTHDPAQMHCIAAIGLVLGTTVLLAAALPAALRYVYPAMALLVAIFLFTRSRTAYIGFVFSLWYLSPFLRRIVDYRAGFVPTNPLLLASFLATAVSGYVLLSRIRMLSQPTALPFTCALAATLFGTIVGLARYPALTVFQATLNWLVPLLFAFFLYAERHRYRDYQSAIERSILYGTLAAGAYGVYQFFFLPAWDRQWMIDLDARTFGVPEALQIRVFSTLNAPATCAAYLMAGMLLLFALKGRLRILAASLAFLSFALTSSRSSWVGMVFGVGYLTMQLPNRARVRVLAGVLACVVLLMAATQLPVVDHILADRLQSFTDPKKDVSYNERVDGHVRAFPNLLDEPLGEGMGSVDIDHATTGGDTSIGPHDSTVLESLYALGLPGSLLYALGFGIALARMAAARPGVQTAAAHPFAISMRAIVIGFAAQLALNSIFVGVFAFMVWTALAMTLASTDLPEELKPIAQRL